MSALRRTEVIAGYQAERLDLQQERIAESISARFSDRRRRIAERATELVRKYQRHEPAAVRAAITNAGPEDEADLVAALSESPALVRVLNRNAVACAYADAEDAIDRELLSGVEA
ncbi:MAG: hypothetical protein ACRYG5_09935 [Janthinobacterium lividum]